MLSNNDNNIQTLKECNALLQGHFILSSGLHSEYYIQCAQIFSYPKIAEKLCKQLIDKISATINIEDIDVVVSPAMGGVIIGYEIARQLNKPNIFCERVSGKFELRRGFNLEDGQNVLVMEDVITTGKSSLETYNGIKEFGVNIVAEACLIKRNSKISTLDNIPLISLIDMEVPAYNTDSIPSHLANIPAIKPGSRFLKK